MRTIDCAVILAAGMGTRLKGICKKKPKGFINFGQEPIVVESISKLNGCGVKKIIIVTGHLSEFYDNLLTCHKEVVTIHNEKFHKFGSLYSLYCVKELVKEDFLLLESDLIYEKKALEKLVQLDRQNAILLSGLNNAGDEAFVETDKDSNLVNMSKNRKELATVAGELVGISKVSLNLFEMMMAQAVKGFRKSLNLDYETDGFVMAAKNQPLFCYKIEDLIWSEIDDERHFQYAKNIIYPAIKNKYQ